MQPQWKGQKPQRFQQGRRHLRPNPELQQNLQPTLSTIQTCGIRTFEQQYSTQHIHRPHLKIYPNKYELSTSQIDLRGKKCLLLPEQKERHRPERAHIVGGGQTSSQFVNRGIRSFGAAMAVTLGEFGVEDAMQRKARVGNYQEQRNYVGTSALGDKAYKYPEYSPDFYLSGGLISGSTFRPKPEKEKEIEKVQKIPVFTKPNWDVRMKMEEVAEEKSVVNAVDEWEQTILKQANPNWNDPDTFFERMEAKKEQKDVKKPGKK